MPKYLIFLLLLLPLSSFAQYTISGRVLNNSDKKPVANADVFLNNATAGTSSDGNGNFRITNVRPGKYFIIVSIVGYTDFSEQVQVVNGEVRLGDIYLAPSNKTLKEVVIKPKEMPAGYLYVFKEQFLGKSEIAHDCKILNPEILTINFNMSDSSYTATSDGYLIIENPDLGYHLKFKLNNFYYSTNPDSPRISYNGFAHFEEMQGKPSDMRRWEKNRYDAYKNSYRHFYRALMADRLAEEGFKAQLFSIHANYDRHPDSVILKKIKYYDNILKGGQPDTDEVRDPVVLREWWKYWQRELKLPKIIRELIPYALTQNDLIRPTDQPGVFAFTCDNDAIFVTYDEQGRFDKGIKMEHLHNPHNTECTLISFNNTFAFLNRDGVMINPAAVSFMGYWVTQRNADLLPVDYDPPQAEGAPVAAVEQADSTVSKNVIVKLNDYNTNHVTEKAYLHFDKPYYAAGDTMFFKAYVTTGEDHQPSTLSNVLHVDLIDGKGSVNQSISLGIVDGVAWGDMVLPDSLAGGNYQVRAYTEWMRNEGPAAFFDKLVPVAAVAGVKSGIKVNTPVRTAAKPDIQFFPEGGNWLPGIKTKIAFKAIGPDGYGMDVRGNVIDNTGKAIGFFISAHKGMGCFYVTGEAGKTYKANVTYPDGTQSSVDLPAFSDKGIAMALNNDAPDKIDVTIMTDPQYLQAHKGKDYTLIIYSNGKASSLIVKLDGPAVPVDIYKQTLHSGIARITLFAPGGEPLCERLVFVQNFDELKLKISADKPGYAVKDKVSLTLNALDEDSAPTVGHFSVSVTDENKVPVEANNENTILTSMLLTSELKGYVEQPNYYFNTPTPDVLNNLDILMLTQGYRSFDWKQVFDGTKPEVKYPAETALTLSGTMKTMNGKPVAGGTVTLLSTRHALAKDTTTDSNGNFKFTGLFLTDTARLVLHGNTKNNNDKVKIEITHDIPAAVRINDPDTSRTPITPEIAAAMKKRYEQSGSIKSGIVLKQVNIKSDKHPAWSRHLEHSDNLNGPGMADNVIMGDQLAGCVSIIQCLQSLIPSGEVRWVGSSATPTAISMRTPIELYGKTPVMAVIIGGVISDQTALYNLNPADIYSIEVLVNMGYLGVYGSKATGGALVVTLKRGGDSPVVSADGTVYYTFHGFDKARAFYSPKYDVATPPATHPDQRATIYWQPELTTDGTGNASFDFFNAADPGTYRVVVEGMDTKGNIGRHVYHYTVK